MPKRPVTPPPGNDEPKYLTIVHPYPLHAHWELQKDREDFARWFACCVDLSAFYAFFHKPSSLNMVIVEIQKDYHGFDRLLGEHRWSEFLRSPSEEEMDQVTKVYYCQYSTGRNVQKMGWKRIDVQAAWFNNWSANNNRINYPYPKTYYCDVPPEDKTNAPICRPLPTRTFVPPKPPPPPVVGSEGWLSNKGIEVSKTRGSYTQKKNVPQAGRGGKASRGRLTVGAPGSDIVRNLPPVSTTGITPSHQSHGSDPSSASSSSPASSNLRTPPLFPPGLGPSRPPGIAKAWSLPRKNSSHTHLALDRDTNISTTSEASIVDDEEDIYQEAEINESLKDTIPVAVTQGMEDGLYKLGLNDADYVAPWEVQKPEEGVIDFDDFPDFSKHKPTVVSEPLKCPAHGKICKKGICAAYAELLRAEKRRQKMEEVEKRGAKGGTTAKGRGSGPSEKMDSSRERSNYGANARGAWGNKTNSRPPEDVKDNSSPNVIVWQGSVVDEEEDYGDEFPVDSSKEKTHAPPESPSYHADGNFDHDGESVAGSEAAASEWGNVSNGPWMS